MSASPMRDRYDVVIAGARCAGASTALLLARAGMSVLVVDPLPRGRDTLSTHALMRAGVMQLERWGLLDAIRAAGTPAVRTTSFHYPDESIEIAIKPGDGVAALYAPRRTLLDPILANAAEDAGAHVVHGAFVADLVRSSGGRVLGAAIGGPGGTLTRVRAGLVIGADGIHSKVARLVRAPVLQQMSHAAAAIYGHWQGIHVDGYHWHFGSGIAAGAIPTNDDTVCVFAVLPSQRFRSTAHDAIAQVYRETVRALDPVLDAVLSEVKEAPKLRAFAGVPGYIRRSAGPGWALVGDASFFRDPSTAHGITDALRDALRDAELLARAILSRDRASLRGWQMERDAIVTPMLEITDRISSFDWTTGQLKALHLDLSRSMNATVHVLREIGATDVSRTPVPAGV